MRDNYDFSDAVRNPFAGRKKGNFTVTVHYGNIAKTRTFENTDEIKKEIERYESKRKVSTVENRRVIN